MNSIDFELLVFIHLVISVMISFSSSMYLQKKYKDKKWKIMIFLLLFNLILPVIAYISTLIISYYLVHVKYETNLKNVEYLDLTLFETSFIKVRRYFGEGLIQTILLNEYVPTEKKIMALVAISENISKDNINIIKTGLTSQDDEVRLYAFSILDKLEKDINGKISQNLLKYKKSVEGSKESAKYAKELALLYWELIYYELSDDVLLHYLLNEVKKYALIAKEVLKHDMKLSFLLGRVYMRENNYERAQSEFIAVTEIDRDMLPYTASYICELYFRQRSFKPIKSIMQQTKNLELNKTLYPIVEQWRSS